MYRQSVFIIIIIYHKYPTKSEKLLICHVYGSNSCFNIVHNVTITIVWL